MTEQLALAEPSPAPPGAVLVCGASFAGLATAYWMNRLGYLVTVVEGARGLRKGGTPVDIEGEALDALARMGALDAVRAKALPPRRFEFKDADDLTLGGFQPDPSDEKSTRLEIHRDDLLDILSGLVAGKVDVLFGRSVSRLEQASAGVSATFDDGSRSDYALVFGCDGNRSSTRRHAFGDVEEASQFMGGYFLIKVVPTTVLLPANTSQLFSAPGRTALLNGYDDRTDIAFAFRSEHEVGYDYRDRAQQRGMVHAHFDGLGWKVPAMLEQLDADDDFYFDRLNQIRMPTWSNGRIALVGDAGYCVSPVAGMGGSVAIIGATRLADALERHGPDHAAAFCDYHDGLHRFVEAVQDTAVTEGMATMFPADEAELAERDRKLGEGALEL